MENNTELVRLEQFVDNLLGKHRKLKEMFGQLEMELEEKEKECAKLKETIAELRDERSEVGSRVSGLLERIERWELEEEDRTGAGDESEGVQGKLFQKESAAAK